MHFLFQEYKIFLLLSSELDAGMKWLDGLSLSNTDLVLIK